MANLSKAAEVPQPTLNPGDVAAVAAPVASVAPIDPTVAEVNQVLSYVDIVAPLIGSFNPAVGAGIKLTEGIARLAVPSIVSAYKAIVTAFKANAPANVSIEEWAEQLRKDAIATDPGLLLLTAEDALGVPRGVYGPADGQLPSALRNDGPADGAAGGVKEHGLPPFLAHFAPS